MLAWAKDTHAVIVHSNGDRFCDDDYPWVCWRDGDRLWMVHWRGPRARIWPFSVKLELAWILMSRPAACICEEISG